MAEKRKKVRTAERSASMMKAQSRQVQDHYTRTLPESRPLLPYPFAAPIVRWLWIGILVGGVVGFLLGLLMVNNRLIIPGTEGLYSMAPFTFVAFWVFAGSALGIATIGVAGLFSVDPEAVELEHPKEGNHA